MFDICKYGKWTISSNDTPFKNPKTNSITGRAVDEVTWTWSNRIIVFINQYFEYTVLFRFDLYSVWIFTWSSPLFWFVGRRYVSISGCCCYRVLFSNPFNYRRMWNFESRLFTSVYWSRRTYFYRREARGKFARNIISVFRPKSIWTGSCLRINSPCTSSYYRFVSYDNRLWLIQTTARHISIAKAIVFLDVRSKQLEFWDRRLTYSFWAGRCLIPPTIFS